MEQEYERKFDRYDVTGLASVAPILRRRGSGIYVLEFANGEQYVGQTLRQSTRFSQHRHGGKHHAAWEDIVALQVMDVPTDQLNAEERALIASKRAAGIQLRNRVFNFGFTGPTPLDDVIPVQDQQHWIAGNGDFGLEQFQVAAQREMLGETKLCASKVGQEAAFPWEDRPDYDVANATIDALAIVVSRTIPDAIATEGEYWTVSDFPATARGRLATLNAGRVELAWLDRERCVEISADERPIGMDHALLLTLPPGTLWQGKRDGGTLYGIGESQDVLLPGNARAWVEPTRYGETDADTLIVALNDFLDYADDWEDVVFAPMRSMALDLMRKSSSAIFARHHSRDLATLLFKAVVEQSSENDDAISAAESAALVVWLVGEFQANYPERDFPLAQELIESMGHASAADLFGLTLIPGRRRRFDATTPDGRSVDIYTCVYERSVTARPARRLAAEFLIVVQLVPEAEGGCVIVYNGPMERALRAGRETTSGVFRMSLSALARADTHVAPGDRLAMIGSAGVE